LSAWTRSGEARPSAIEQAAEQRFEVALDRDALSRA
jgi:hypothetical protein